MKPLHPDYQKELDEIAALIPASEEYEKYLEDEEEEDYQQIRDRFEPMVKALYVKVAKANPLQVVSLEKQLLDPKFEGMFLARILGYTVLRGQINNDHFKYEMPQEHFKDVLMAVCNSSNFEYLRKRIGQTIQTGFALSSDIWVTNLINEVVIKQVRYFLQSQKLPKYRDIRERKIGYARYSNQFKADFFRSAQFPTTANEMKLYFAALRKFLEYRVQSKLNNSSLTEPILTLLNNDEFKGSFEHVVVSGLFAGFFDLSDADKKTVGGIIDEMRKSHPETNEYWLQFIMETHDAEITMDATAELNISKIIDKSISDDIAAYYTLMETVHGKGYIHEDTVEAVKVFYANHEGMSVINQCVRKTILSYIQHFLSNLKPEEYSAYFELSKIFPTYMGIFSNQQFNQDLKVLCVKYIKILQKRYTDKRGRDYQDIKKFVQTNFLDLEFMKKKELIEFFKTTRKKKATA